MTINCISPIDGSIFVSRETLSYKDARAATARAKVAQASWAVLPLSDRIDLVRAGVAAVGATAGWAGRGGG